MLLFGEKPKQPENQEKVTAMPQSSEPEIFVMPDLAPAKVPRARMKLPSARILLIGVGGVLIIALGVGAFFFLRAPKPRSVPKAPLPPRPAVEAPQQPVVTPPPPAPPPATTTPISPPIEPQKPPEVLAFGPDDDSDGITNQEERLLYKSDSLRPDTDGDGFLDGNEVFHLYSPSAPTPVDLLGSGLVQVYENNEFKYSIFYPTDWVVSQASTSTTRETLIRATTGEAVTITATDNPENLSLFDWYTRESAKDTSSNLEPIVTKKKLQALQTPNRLTTYVALPGKVLVVSLNIGDKTQVEYRRTYEMMLNSLIAK